MESLFWLLCAVSSFQYVASQITLVESGPLLTVKPAETLQMTCKVTGASLTDSINMYGVSWILQTAQSKLLWLGANWYDDTKSYASSLQGRLTQESRDVNKGEVYLKITGMKPEESGKYYCARTSTVQQTHWQPVHKLIIMCYKPDQIMTNEGSH